jgi:hypothetical protein
VTTSVEETISVKALRQVKGSRLRTLAKGSRVNVGGGMLETRRGEFSFGFDDEAGGNGYVSIRMSRKAAERFAKFVLEHPSDASLDTPLAAQRVPVLA